MSNGWIAIFVLLGVSGVVLADDSVALKRAEEAATKYEAAETRDSEQLFKSLIVADKKLIDDLKSALKIAKGDDVKSITAKLNQAQTNLDSDQAALDARKIAVVHPEYKDPSDYIVALHTDIKVGMTEKDVDDIQTRRGWKKNKLSESAAGTIYEYLGFTYTPGHQDKDTVYFKDGKVVEIDPTRCMP